MESFFIYNGNNRSNPAVQVLGPRTPGVDLSDWCNWRGALRHRSGDVVPAEDLIEALVRCFLKLLAQGENARICRRHPKTPVFLLHFFHALFFTMDAVQNVQIRRQNATWKSLRCIIKDASHYVEISGRLVTGHLGHLHAELRRWTKRSSGTKRGDTISNNTHMGVIP